MDEPKRKYTELFFPMNVRAQNELWPGFSFKALPEALLLTACMGGVCIAIGTIYSNPVVAYLGVIVSGMISIGWLKKNDENTSLKDTVIQLIAFAKSQKKLPYVQLPEWGAGVNMKMKEHVEPEKSKEQKPAGGQLLQKLVGRKTTEKTNQQPPDPSTLTAQAFVNVLDVRDSLLFTKDGYAISYVRVQPVSIELMMPAQKSDMIRLLTNEMGNLPQWRFYSIGRPVDISAPINHLAQVRSDTVDSGRKAVLSMMIQDLSNYAMSSDVMDRQYYFILWSKATEVGVKELKQRAADLVVRLQKVSINSKVETDMGIKQLCNLFANPYSAGVETPGNYDAAIPLMRL